MCMPDRRLGNSTQATHTVCTSILYHIRFGLMLTAHMQIVI
jgi:hypothetical protein